MQYFRFSPQSFLANARFIATPLSPLLQDASSTTHAHKKIHIRGRAILTKYEQGNIVHLFNIDHYIIHITKGNR